MGLVANRALAAISSSVVCAEVLHYGEIVEKQHASSRIVKLPQCAMLGDEQTCFLARKNFVRKNFKKLRAEF